MDYTPCFDEASVPETQALDSQVQSVDDEESDEEDEDSVQVVWPLSQKGYPDLATWRKKQGKEPYHTCVLDGTAKPKCALLGVTSCW